MFLSGGPIFSQCAPAGHPLSILCDNWSVIYIRQTMYSEYYGVSNVGCQLPVYNSLCHAFSNTSDFYYNGKYQAEHTFLSQKLSFVGRTFGVNCNESATVRVVQLLYECLTGKVYRYLKKQNKKTTTYICILNALVFHYRNHAETCLKY